LSNLAPHGLRRLFFRARIGERDRSLEIRDALLRQTVRQIDIAMPASRSSLIPRPLDTCTIDADRLQRRTASSAKLQDVDMWRFERMRGISASTNRRSGVARYDVKSRASLKGGMFHRAALSKRGISPGFP
jgi:hypothetical protein